MKKSEFVVMAIVVLCLGTAMHFEHHLFEDNPSALGDFLGYIFPINECCWEHMKMVFYPMLLCGIWCSIREKSIQPFGGYILSGIACIPFAIALFYGYFVFVKHTILALDIICYIVEIFCGVILGKYLSQKAAIRRISPWMVVLAVVVLVVLAVLTYHNPDWHIFRYVGE